FGCASAPGGGRDCIPPLHSHHEGATGNDVRLFIGPRPGPRGGPPLGKGRAIGWIGEALSPLRGVMSARDIRRLIFAIRSAAGIEALVWLTDIAGLSRKEAVELMRWSAGALLRSAMGDGGATRHQARPSRRPKASSRRRVST